jgi:trigger factor
VPLALNTRVTELADSRVRVDVEVPPDELEGHLQRKARELGRELKLPGFRRGKVPPALVIKRIGREAVLDEAVRDTLASWYSDAIERAGIVPVGDPKLELGKLPPAGKALEFSIEIGVLPTATLGDYLGLEVPRREPEAQDAQIDAAVEALRERLARLQTAERPAAVGDFVVIDYAGTLDDSDADADTDAAGRASGGAGEQGERKPFPGGEARDQLVELGGGNLLPGFEEALLGASAGDIRTVAVTFPADYPSERLAGRDASFEVTVKEVKLKELPPLDDDLAVDSGFDDLEELRADISEHLLADDRAAVEAEFRQAALDAAVSGATMDVTPELVRARAQEMWERMLRSLAQRGITREGYLRLSGNREQEVVGELEPEAELALRREAVITAVVAAEGIGPSEEDVLAALAPAAEREEVEATELLEQLRSAGRLEELQEDLAARQAIDLIAERAKPIPPAQARAREQLWTPEKAADAAERRPAPEPAPARLWTPDR